MTKHIIILFGEMGCGKNYWGEQVAKEMGYPFYDGDQAAPAAVIDKVSRFKLLDRALILHFVNHLCLAIIQKLSETDTIVVAQALYFDQDRKYIKEELNRLGYQVTFQWVRPSFWRNLKQVYSRPNGLKWAVYWLRNKPWFQKPTHEYTLIG